MARSITVECPGCLARLNISDSSKIGKKIKCPKCSDIFVAEAMDGDEDEEKEAPSRSKGRKKAVAGKKGGGKKGGSTGGNSNGVLIGVGAVVLVVAIGAGLFFSGAFGGRAVPPAPANTVVAAPSSTTAPPTAGAHGAPASAHGTPASAHGAPAAAHGSPPQSAPTTTAAVTPSVATTPAIVPTSAKPASKFDDLGWMPEDAELVLHLKVAELWKAPLLKEAVNSPALGPFLHELSKMELVPTNIESVTLGVADLEGLGKSFMSQLFGMPSDNKPKAMAVIRTTKPILADGIMNIFPMVAKLGPTDFQYSYSKGEYIKGTPIALNLVVLGTAAEFDATYPMKGSVKPRPELTFMDSSAHALLIVAVKNPKALSGGMEPPPLPPETPPELVAMNKALTDSCKGFGLAINVRGGVDVQTGFLMADAAATSKVKAGMDAGIVESRKDLDKFKESGQPLLADLGEIALKNLKLETQGQVVRVSTSIPDSEQQNLEKIPGLLAGMAAMSGLGGGLNPFSMGGAKGGGFGPGLDMKNPGETPAVEADVATGLPPNLKLTACTSWSMFPSFTPDLKVTYPMDVILDIKGDELSSICAYGQLKLKPMNLSEGGTLKPKKSDKNDFGIREDATKQILPYIHDDFELGRPANTLRIAVSAEPPGNLNGTIASMDGTFKLLISDDVEEFMIDDALKAAKRPLADPKLKEAGVRLILKGSNESLTLSCAKGYYVTAEGVNPAADNPILARQKFKSDFEKDQPVQRLSADLLSPNGRLPEKLNLKIKLYRNVKEQVVNFKVANVALPTEASKPKTAEPPALPK